ncbi:ankyrin repeat-containing protein YAR1 [Bimuria novae-zelandiae CBS 107.79]|uniref:Ankyrin repeat-containing protein YAR1 n=1 Tax=Bimuria novae-zelandiae CBS 107.79 TaxID=1447943 RepID=A0A6A5UWM4_9PLEO|nr:ankyrin repeat-containing protein YAR1 [Bimuria novae-zelandiae CBS 107.79]
MDDDAVDEILYLARANEPAELSAYLTDLSAQVQQSKAELVAAAADPYSKNTALHYAAANGHASDIVKLLFSLETGKASAPASGLINAANDAGNTALHWAALNGHLECVKMLVQAGADVTMINKAGHDAVFEAEINDKGNVVDWLLGAVEELEKGIGRAGESSGGELGADAQSESTAQNGSSRVDSGSVEGVRRQLGSLETHGASKDG